MQKCNQSISMKVWYIRGNANLSGCSDTSLSLATSESGPNMTTGRTKVAEDDSKYTKISDSLIRKHTDKLSIACTSNMYYGRLSMPHRLQYGSCLNAHLTVQSLCRLFISRTRAPNLKQKGIEKLQYFIKGPLFFFS